MLNLISLIALIAIVDKFYSIHKLDHYYFYNNDPTKVYVVSKRLLVKIPTNDWVNGFVYHKLYTDDRLDTTFVREITNFNENFTKTTLRDVEKKSNLGYFNLYWKLSNLI